ncbi:MAG: HesB/IscA family protein [Anaerolineae bacterium]|nr:iron-sulfur cluster assembly accessory protein [Ardenticatenia bacterium]
MIREDITLKTHVLPTIVAPIAISEAAAAKLSEVMRAKDLGDAGLRVFVSGGGCSGLQYGMAFETAGGEADDMVFEAHGLQVYVDPVSGPYLQGTTIDYVDSLMGGGFKIENPNAVSSCGCGSSFKPKGEGAEPAAAQGGSCGSGGGGGCGCH